jgi:serine/threonine-protein kinase
MLLLAAGRAEEAADALTGAYLPAGDGGPGSLASMQLSLLRAEVELALHHPDSALKLAAGVYQLATAGTQRAYLKLYAARAALDTGKALLLQGDDAHAAAALSEAVALHTELDPAGSNPSFADALIALAECRLDTHRTEEARALAKQAGDIQAANARLGNQFRAPWIRLQERLRDTGLKKR